MKDKKGITVITAFQKTLDESYCKPNKIWNKSIKFYKQSMDTWLKDNDKEIYLTHDEGKSLVAESLLDLPRVKFTNK